VCLPRTATVAVGCCCCCCSSCGQQRQCGSATSPPRCRNEEENSDDDGGGSENEEKSRRRCCCCCRWHLVGRSCRTKRSVDDDKAEEDEERVVNSRLDQCDKNDEDVDNNRDIILLLRDGATIVVAAVVVGSSRVDGDGGDRIWRRPRGSPRRLASERKREEQETEMEFILYLRSVRVSYSSYDIIMRPSDADTTLAFFLLYTIIYRVLACLALQQARRFYSIAANLVASLYSFEVL